VALVGLTACGEKSFDDIVRESGRAKRVGVKTTPARFYLGQHFSAAPDDGLAESPHALDLLQKDGGNNVILKEGWLAIDDLVFQCDSSVSCHGINRGKSLPMTENGSLYPLQVAGIVDMPHEVDVGLINRDTMIMR